MENRKLVNILGGAGLVAVTWLGGSFYVNQQTEAEIKTIVDKAGTGCAVRIQNPKHQQSLFSSSGQFELHAGDQCNVDKDLRDLLVSKVEYKTNSLILPNALTRFEWTLKQVPAEESKADSLLELTGEGVTRLTGATFSTIQSQAFTGYFDEGSWRLEPLVGDVEWHDNAVLFNLKSSRLVSRGGGDAIDIQGIGLHADLSDTTLSIGNTAFTVDKISTSQGFGQGFSISTMTTQNTDRLDSQVIYALNAFNALGYDGQDLKVELGLNGMHMPSIKTLMELSEDSSSIQNLTVEEDQKYRAAIRELVNQGLSVSLTKLAGTVKNAADTSAIDGNFKIVIKPNSAKDQAIQLAKVLESYGQVILKGNVLGDEQKNQLTQIGSAVSTPDGLKASYEYSAGILKTNERIFDQQTVQAALISADTYINAFLNKPIKDSLAGSAFEVTPPEAVKPDFSSAEAPEELVNTAISGFPTFGSADSMLEDSNGNRVYFQTNSDIGHQIIDTCREGNLCVVTGMVDNTNEYQYLKQLQSVVLVPTTVTQPEAAYAAPPTTSEVPAVVQTPVQPSFDCNKASTKVEKLICSSSDVAAADVQLSQLYKQLVANSPAAETIVADQKVWMKSVRGACVDEQCLNLAYQLRFQQLASY